MRIAQITALMALLSGGVLAQQGLQYELSDWGAVESVTVGETLVAQAIGVAIVKPGWEGHWGSQAAAALQVERTEADGRVVFRGEFPAEGNPVAFEQTVEATQEALKLSYALTPSADLDTECVVVTVSLPVAGSAGVGNWYIADGQFMETGALPETLPPAYHLARGSDIEWAGWLTGVGVGAQMAVDGEGLRSVTIQDDRQFGMELFEAHFVLHQSRGLKAGQRREFGLTIRPLTPENLAEEKQQMIDARQMARVAMTSDRPLALRAVTPDRAELPQYELVEFRLDLDATYSNPFDPADIDVTAAIRTPSGRELTVPAFFYLDYERHLRGDRELLLKVGEPQWRLRFTPMEVGPHEVRIAARDRTGTVQSEPIAITATEAAERGFVRRCPDTPYYLQFDTGDPYFAVGENMCWGGDRQTHDYDEWLPALAAAGGNYIRIWLVRWNMGLEWSEDDGRARAQYYGLGQYSPDAAWRLDHVLARCRELGVYAMLALGYHGELMDTRGYFGEDCWGLNPYNVALGGPCAEPQEFWTNREARKLYQQKLRYFIARFGAYTSILSWEFWNEVWAPAPWIEEMAQYFRDHDPYAHLITHTYGTDEVWELPQIDYTQTHTYGADGNRHDSSAVLARAAQLHTERFEKPYMMGEFGIDWKAGENKHDTANLGTHLHNGIWASVMGRSFGTAALWYWDGYVHPGNHYDRFTGLAKFVAQVPWTQYRPRIAEFGLSRLPENAEVGEWDDFVVRSSLGWQKATGTDFIASRDGRLLGEGQPSPFLFSDSKPDMKQPYRIKADMPQAGQLVLHVDTVSASAVIHVRLDGEEIWTRELLAGEGEGPWKSTELYGDDGPWQSTYDEDFAVDIPAGEHVIELENTGGDWVSVPSIRLTGYVDPRLGRVEAYGLCDDRLALVWLRDKRSTWYNDAQGVEPARLEGLTCPLRGLPAGEYEIEWWDTRQGEPLQTRPASCRDGELLLQPPPFGRDIAAQIRRAE